MSDDGNLGVEVAVVGAGLAGLAAATVAARQGISVALLDVRSAGGRARSDQRDDYVLNQGPHAVYRSGAGSGVLSRVGVALQGAPPHPAVAGYRGATGDLAVLPTSVASLLRSPLVGMGDKVRLGRLLTTLPKVDASSLASQSAAGWIDSLGLKPNGVAVLTTLMRVATYAGDLRLISADAAVGNSSWSSRGTWSTSTGAGKRSSTVWLPPHRQLAPDSWWANGHWPSLRERAGPGR